jgi:hypothetical protein
MSTTIASPNKSNHTPAKQTMTFTEAYRREVLEDYRICCLSREASVIARKEVLQGNANFGIIGDGKEVAQVAPVITATKPSCSPWASWIWISFSPNSMVIPTATHFQEAGR